MNDRETTVFIVIDCPADSKHKKRSLHRCEWQSGEWRLAIGDLLYSHGQVDRHGALRGPRGARAVRRRRAALAAHLRYTRRLQWHAAHLVLRFVRQVRTGYGGTYCLAKLT